MVRSTYRLHQIRRSYAPRPLRDHPLVSRYAGSSLIGYDVRAYDAFALPLGKARVNEAREHVLAQSQDVAGRVTRLLYVAPEGRSSLEIYRN